MTSKAGLSLDVPMANANLQFDLTVIIGRIVSIYFLATALGFLASANYYADMIATNGSDPVLINLSGMTHFLIGMAIVVLHFRWRGLHQILVSLSGLFYLLKGTFLIVLPELTLQSGNNDIQASLVIPAIGFMVFGGMLAFLSWKKRILTSFTAKSPST